MKKTISIFLLLILLIQIILCRNSYAVELTSLSIQTDKTVIRPGEEVSLTIEFGESLGAYTFNISYDNNIFDYYSVEGATVNDLGNEVKATYYDITGGSYPRNNMSIIFKAKENIITSNPTEFTVTAEGLSNSDATVTFEDITIPIVKNATVEPEYVDYTLKLEPTDNFLKGQEKEMKLSYSSSLGRFYEHARLIAEATSPEGGNVKLLALDNSQLEHDIIQSGWGDAQGYGIGGENVVSELNVRGIFSQVGNYTITLKLINRDDSDKVISEKSFPITVLENTALSNNDNIEQNQLVDNQNTDEIPVLEEVIPGNNSPDGETQLTEVIQNTSNIDSTITESVVSNEVISNVAQNNIPKKLPKTGINFYLHAIVVIISLIFCYIYYNKIK